MSRYNYSSASPNKNFNTRTIYKNEREDETINDNRSLYTVSYGGKATQQPGKVTLADIGAMQRNSSRGSNVRLNPIVSRPQDNQRPVESRQQDLRRSLDSRGSAAGSVKLIEQPDRARIAENVQQAARPNKDAHQCNYESQILKEAMKTTFGGNPHININNEAEYYETVKRLDVCGKCWAAQQKYYTKPFKVKHRGPGQSLYQKDFVKHPLNEQGPTLTNDFYTTLKNNEPMDCCTTMRNDYKAWNVGPVKKESMNFRPATTGIPFAGKSQYKSEYANWGANQTAYEKASQALTTIPELPFNGKTTYALNYETPEATEQLKPKDKLNKKPPITSAIPFLGESTSAATYKPFKVSHVPNFDNQEEYVPTESLPEHHRSLYNRDFAPQPQWVCPAVVFMEQTAHPKQKYLNA